MSYFSLQHVMGFGKCRWRHSGNENTLSVICTKGLFLFSNLFMQSLLYLYLYELMDISSIFCVTNLCYMIYFVGYFLLCSWELFQVGHYDFFHVPILVFFEHIFIFWYSKCFMLILCFPFPEDKISDFSKKHLALVLDNDIRKESSWWLDVVMALRCHCFWAFLMGKVRQYIYAY